jgi:hypothetical protein
MRWWIAAAALVMCVPAQAEPAASAPARAFAVAWVDRETTVRFGRLALEQKLATCIKRGMIAPDVLAVERPLLDLYMDTFFEGTARVQDKVAVKAQTLLAPAELRVLAQTFSTPDFRALRLQAVAGMADKIVPAIPGCGDQGHQVTLGQLGAGVIPHMTKAQIASLSKLALSPAGQHFKKVLPQLMATLTEAYRDEVQHALQVTGASPEAQHAARAVASPLVIDPPAPAPPPHP